MHKKWSGSVVYAATETRENVTKPVTETQVIRRVSGTVSHVSATFPFTDSCNFVLCDVLLASSWETQKQWEHWPIALFKSLAQTREWNRFWRYTCVISAEVNTLWTELQEKGSPLTYTSDKFRARKCIFCTVIPCQICMGLHEIYSCALLTKREVKMAG